MSFLAFAALLALSAVLGAGLRPLWRDRDDPRAVDWVFRVVAGWVALGGALLWLSVAGVRWTLLSMLPIGGALALWRWRYRGGAPLSASAAGARGGWGWGDGLAGLALATLVAFAARGALLFPDFVYHWGIKAQKFALARGIDFDYLARPWLAQLHHPEYPHLLPTLGALTTLVGGRFDARAAGLWSIAALALAVLAVRGALEAAGASRFMVQAGTAWAGCALAAFGIGQLLAGSADPLVALALLAAVPALTAARGDGQPARDVQVGLAAALAASAKLEGVVLAAILIGVQLVRRAPRASHAPHSSSATAGRRWAAFFASGTRLGAPVAFVVVPWLYACWRHGLRSSAAGVLDWHRLPVVAEGMARQFAGAAWAGAAILCILLPVLLWRRALRPLGLVILLQLGFYTAVYLSAPFAPDYYIVATFPRLLLHVMPALVTGLLIALAGTADRPLSSHGEGLGGEDPSGAKLGSGRRFPEIR